MVFSLFKKKKKAFQLVFICTANVTRSAYFEGYFRHLIEQDPMVEDKSVEISSAGMYASNGFTANHTVSVIARMNGFSLSSHRSRPFNKMIGKNANLILTMEEDHKKKILDENPELEGKVYTVFEFGRTIDEEIPEMKDVPDPTGLEVEEYKEFIDIAHEQAQRIYRIMVLREMF